MNTIVKCIAAREVPKAARKRCAKRTCKGCGVRLAVTYATVALAEQAGKALFLCVDCAEWTERNVESCKHLPQFESPASKAEAERLKAALDSADAKG